MKLSKSTNLRTLASFLGLGLFAWFARVSAQINPFPVGETWGLKDWSYGQGAYGLTSTIVLILVSIAGIVAVLFIIIGGFQYMLSGANEDLAKRGKTTLVNSVIGLIIILLSYTIIRVIFNQLTGFR